MAKVTFTSAVVETKNEARLAYFHIRRHLDHAGQPILDGAGDEQLLVEAVALVGNFDGATWTVHDNVSLSVLRKVSTVAAFFGTTTLAGMEQKMLQFMQNEGLLPAGTVS